MNRKLHRRRGNATSGRLLHQRRRLWAELLESRRLLSADWNAGDGAAVSADVCLPFERTALDGSPPALQGQDDDPAVEAADPHGFANGLRQAVEEIGRLMTAVQNMPALAQEVPLLGALLPASVGGTTLVDTETIATLFELAERFDHEITQPLLSFLEANPAATASQLTSQLAFLEPLDDPGGGTGVRLRFAPAATLDSSLATLLEPITTRGDSLLSGISGDALQETLAIEATLQDFAVEIIQGNADEFRLSIPDLQLIIADQLRVPVDFAANLGFLSGSVMGGELLLDVGVELDTASLWGEQITLEALRELPLVDALAALEVDRLGNGLQARFPFEFNLPGFDSAGFPPVLTLADANPLDARLPSFQLEVPRGADYSADALKAFTRLNATSLLSTLDEFGAMLGAWEQGEVLNHPLPLGDNLSVGEIAGFSDAYSGAVLQFLRTADGLPAFNSIQELIDLVPRAAASAGDFVRYESDSRTLTLDLGAVWEPEDLVRQASLDVIAGHQASPLVAMQMTPGEDGTQNRLVVTRDVQMDFEIEIDLGSDHPQQYDVYRVNNALAADGRRDILIDDERVTAATPMMTILERLGLAHLADVPQSLRVALHDGSQATAELGTIDEHVTLGEWLERGTVRNAAGELLMTLEFEPTVVAESPFGNLTSRFVVRDHTLPDDRLDIRLDYIEASGSNTGFYDTTPLDDPDIFWATTLGEARRFVIEQTAEHLETILADAGTYDTLTMRVTFDPSLTAGAFDYADGLADAISTSFTAGDPALGQDPGLTYPAALFNVTAGSNAMAGPEIVARFNPLTNWDYDVTGAPDPDRYSLLETAVHEVLHGLGFGSFYSPAGNFYAPTGLPMPYDQYLVVSDRIGDEANATFTPLADLATSGDVAAALVSGRLYSVAPGAMAVNPIAPGLPIRLYAPNPFEAGSSVVHVDQATYEVFGETMTPLVEAGNPKPIGISEMSAAFLRDLGYPLPQRPETEVLAGGPFWGALLQTDTEPFFVPTSIDLSEPLAHGDLSTRLTEIDGAFRRAGDTDVPPFTLTLASGQSETITLGRSDTLDLAAVQQALSLSDGATPLTEAFFVDGALVVEDFTEPAAGSPFSLALSQPHPIERFLPSQTARADSSLLVFEDFLPGLPRHDAPRLRPTTRLTDLLSPTEASLVLGRSHSARLELIDGTSQAVATGVLTANSTLQDLLDALHYQPAGISRVQAHLPAYDDRIVVHDRLGVYAPEQFDDFIPPGPLSKEPLQLIDTTLGTGIFELLFASHIDGGPNQDGDAFLHSDSLATRRFSRIEAPRERIFYVDELTEVPAWTPLATIIDRQLPQWDTVRDQSLRIQLRDGSVAEFTLPGDARTYSLATALAQLKSFDPVGNLRAEVEMRDGELVVVDHTGGTTSELAWVSADPLFDTLFASFRSEGVPQERLSDSLSQSVFSRYGGQVNLANWHEPGLSIDAGGSVTGNFFANASANTTTTAPITIKLQDGSTHTVGSFAWVQGDLLELLDRFTIYTRERQVLEAWVENDAIHLRDLTTPTADSNGIPHTFSVGYATAGDGNLALSRMIPFGSDADGDGQLHGPRLLPTLPSVNSSLVSAETRLADVLDRLLIRDELGKSQSMNVRLSDGVDRTLELDPLDAMMTLGELASRMRIVEANQLVLDVHVAGGRLMLEDLTAGTARLATSPNVTSEGALFAALGLLGDDPTAGLETQPGENSIASGSLAVSPLSHDTKLGDLFGDDSDLFGGGPIELTFEAGDAVNPMIVPDQQIGPFAATDTLQDLLLALTIADPTGTHQNLISANLVGERIVVSHGGGPTFANPAALQLGDGIAPNSRMLRSLLSEHFDADNDGRFVSESLIASLATSPVHPGAPLEELFPAGDFDTRIAAGSSVPIVVTLADGTSTSIVVDHRGSMTLAEYLSQFEIERDGRTVLAASLQIIPQPSGPDRYRPVLRDRTTAASTTPLALRIDYDSQPPAAAAIPLELGLIGIDSMQSGKIAGTTLAPRGTGGLASRVRVVTPPSLSASFSAVATNVQASARIGELLAAEVRNGNGSLSGSIDLSVPLPSGRDYLTLGDLADAIVQPWDALELELDTDFEFGAEVIVDVAGLNDPPGGPGETPRFDVVWDDILTADPSLRLQPENFQFTTENLDNLFDFSDVSVQDVIELIERVVAFVSTLSGQDLLGEPLPLIGVSLGEVLAISEDVADLVDQLQDDPESLLNDLEAEIEQQLGLEDDQLDIWLDTTARVIRVDLRLDYEAQATHALDVDLSEISGFNTFDAFVDFTATSQVSVEASSELRAHLGLDVAALQSADFDDAVRIYDTSGVSAAARVFGEDLNFSTALLSLEAAVAGGRVAFDRDGLNFRGGPDSNQPVDLSIGAGNWIGGFKTLSELRPEDFQRDLDLQQGAAIGVDLPLEILGQSTQLQLQWAELDSFAFDVLPANVPITTQSGNTLAVPAVEETIENLTLGEGISALAAGLQGLFESLESQLGDEILGIDVPLIGDALEDAVQFVDRFVAPLADAFNQGFADSPQLGEEVAAAIFAVLGPGSGGSGLDVVDDRNGDGAVTADDIGVITYPDNDRAIGFALALDLGSLLRNVPIHLDLGGRGIGLEVAGDVLVDAGLRLDVGIGIDLDAGPFIEFFDSRDLAFEYYAGIEDLLAEGRLGPLALTISTIDAADLEPSRRVASRLDPNDAATEAVNAVRGSFGIDFPDGIYTLGDLDQAFSGVQVQSAFVGSLHAHFDTGLNTSIEGLPTLVADLHVQFDAVSGTLQQTLDSIASPHIALTDVGLDLGSFVTDVIAPVLEPVQEFLEPLQPTIEKLTTPIPVLSDVIGETTFVDLIGLFGSGGETVVKFVNAILTINDAIANLPLSADGLILPLGNFTIESDASGEASAVQDSGAAGQSLDDFLSGADAGGTDVGNFLEGLPRNSAAGSAGGQVTREKGKFSFPILENPVSAVGLLFGNDIDLIKFQAPVLEAEFSFNVGIPIFPAFEITFGGRFNAIIDFAFGYDTLGMRQFAESGRAIDLLNGFYLDDYREVGVDASGAPIYEEQPELTFAFAVTAGGELDLAVAKAGVQVELGAQLLLDLNDPDGDTKVRLDELAANIQLGTAPALGPLWIFDASGQLTAALNAYVKALGFRVNARLGPKVLVNYDFPRPEPADIVLGRLEEDGTLILHIGPEAENRVGGDARDHSETIFVEYDEETGKTEVTGFGETDEFSGVTRLVADGGDGQDLIFVDDTFTRPVEIDGGYGSDEIELGGGPGIVRGGWGNDIIIGGGADDQIFGQGTSDPPVQQVEIGNGETITIEWSDHDVINGDEGDDLLVGGPGDDNLKGDEGEDRITGGDGDDFVNGGDGSDVLIGGAGDDVLSGDDGDDVLYGDAESEDDGPSMIMGYDVLLGGDGADLIYGGGLDDELFGGLGPDQLFAGSGNDLIVGAVTSRDDPNFASLQPAFDVEVHTLDGGPGNDLIYGTAGPDAIVDSSGRNRIFTYEADDTVSTADGDDLIETGAGDDVVQAGGGRNEIRTGAGFDIVDSGTGADLIDLRPRQSSTVGSETAGGQVTDLGGDNRIFTDDGDDIIDVLSGGTNFVDAGGGDNFIRTLGAGGDVILTGGGNDYVESGDGANEISTSGGDDSVIAGGGNDRVFLGAGNNSAVTGAGDDVIVAGEGADVLNAGSGNDTVRAGDGDDVLVGGIGDDVLYGEAGEDVIWGGLLIYSRADLLAELVTPIEYDPQRTAVAFPALVPAMVASGPLQGSLEDGSDRLLGGGGRDYLFGGGGNDRVEGGLGGGYSDGGRGDDFLLGTPGPDVLRGGDGDDRIEAGAHIDFSYGDDGDDFILGGSGVRQGGSTQTYGQSGFGGSGNDVLWAYAESTQPAAERRLLGERLEGGEGSDELLGNLRQDILDGGGGDDLLLGDALSGPDYQENILFRTAGGDDLILGGDGDDLLQGGGGNDILWGGRNVDELEGHAGEDQLFGGSGIDFLRLDVDPQYAFGGDRLDGHFGEAPDSISPDDFATDIVLINGTANADSITLSGDGSGQAIVAYNNRDLPITIFDPSGELLIEQFQINGLAGDDQIGFDDSFDTAALAARSRDWIGVLQGGAGDDTLSGSSGRDRIDGGRGSDVLYGLDGDDRLWGDAGEGASGDVDRLYAGGGNDDLLGGVGTNELYAWSSDPTADGLHPSGPQFGVFDPDGNREDTGLNRMLGRDGDDRLFAGTGLDFMYGGEGQDVLHDVDGEPLEDLGVPAGDEWLAYARENDAIWYYGGTDRSDVITVDYVTEPGLLGDHHLITRLTENNGFFSFDAQVRLDFAATNPDGSLVWDPADLVYEVQSEESGSSDDARSLAARTRQLAADLLPPEGDFTAILIDARGGDDQVSVGPTVQKTVWTAAGDGDDRVEYASGSALLVDVPDTDPRNEVAGAPDDYSAAYDLGQVSDSNYFERLTLDNPADVDWYRFSIEALQFAPFSQFVVDSLSSQDAIELQLYVYDASDDTARLLATADLNSDPATLDPQRPARSALSIAGQSFPQDQAFYIRVRSLNGSPTSYNLGIDFAGPTPLGVRRETLGSTSANYLRRDVLVGGDGDDVLRGGPGEDWLIGGAGDDVLTGGVDGSAADILIGESGDDVFQVIPSAASSPGGGDLTLTDEFEGGAGFDRVLFSGGDRDASGKPIPDLVTLRYQPLLNRYELAAQVWDTANAAFLISGDDFVVHTAAYRTRDIEATELVTHDGDDEVRLDAASYSIIDGEPVRVSGFQFARPDGSADTSETWGISPGDRQVGGAAANFIVSGGAGNDRIVGSPYADRLEGGAGIDQIIGGGGNDTIAGDAGNDLLLGDEIQANTTLLDRFEFSTAGISNDTPLGAVPIDLETREASGFTLHDGDITDWYVVPPPESRPLLPGNVGVAFDDALYQQIAEAAGTERAEVVPARFDEQSGSYLPSEGAVDAYLIGVRNPMTGAIIAAERPGADQLASGTSLDVEFYIDLEGTYRRSLSLQIDAGSDGGSLADELNAALTGAGIAADLRAFYDPTQDRLLLLSIRGKTATLARTTASSLAWLGFVDGQTTGGLPTGLGSYRLTSTLSIPPFAESGPSREPIPFRYPTATRELLGVAPGTPLVLDAVDADLADAWVIEGAASGQRLSELRSIGDVNGDGRQDVMMVSATTAYVLLGNVEPVAGVEGIRALASYEIDLTTGGGSYIPIDGVMDLDGDGKSDLSFAFVNPSGVINIYALSGDVLTARDPGEVAFNRDARVFPVTTFANRIETVTVLDPEVPLDFAWLQYSGDGIPDLAIFAREPVMQINGNAIDLGYGVVKDGADLQSYFTGPGDGGATNLVSINDAKEDGRVVGAGRYSGNYRILDATDELRLTTGDLTGDDREELLLTLPRGWQADTSGDGDPDEVLARTYVVSANPTANQIALNAALGSSEVPAILEVAERAGGPRQPGVPASGMFGALNPDMPLYAADFDADGIDEVVAIADANYGTVVGAPLRIFTANELLGSDQVGQREPRVTLQHAFDAGDFLEAEVTGGDFDGDGGVDLVIAGRSGITLFYDPLSGPARRTVDDEFGDARVDAVGLPSPLGTGRFGRLPTVPVDVTGDDIIDLPLGSPDHDSVTGFLDAGAVYLIAGGPRRIGLPAEDEIVDLGNDSIRGIGDVVRSSQGDIVVEGQLAGPGETDWYRFRTVGDGRIGNRINLFPHAAAGQPTVIARGANGIYSGDNAFDNVPLVRFDASQSGVLEFDVSSLLSELDDPSRIGSAALRVTGSSEAAGSSEALRGPEELTPISAGVAGSDRVYFVAESDAHGRALFVTDGTAAGTRVVFELRLGPDSDQIQDLRAVGGYLIFTTVSGGGEESGPSFNLWVTDGQETNRITSEGEFRRAVRGTYTVYQDALYFLHNEEDPDLARVTITEQGTGQLEVVADLPSGDLYPPGRMEASPVGLFFARGNELWISDGSSAGTERLRVFDRIGIAFNDPLFASLADGVVFEADDGSGSGMRLFFSDGTAAGTKPIFDPSADSSSGIHALTKVGDAVFFNDGSDLYRTDGTESGTRRVRELASPKLSGGGLVETLVVDGLHVAVFNRDATEIVVTVTDAAGREVSSRAIRADRRAVLDGIGQFQDQILIGYRIDDAAFEPDTDYVSVIDPRTGALRVLFSGLDDNYTGSFTDFVEAGNLSVFGGVRDDNEFGEELWTTDLTAQGTVPIADQTGGGSAAPITLHFRGGRNDNVVTGSEDDTPIAFSATLTLDSETSTETIDLSNHLDALRGLFARGYRTITVIAEIDAGEATIEPIGGSASETALLIGREGGVRGQLVDANGRLIAGQFTSLDLRNLPAGAYVLGISPADANAGPTDYGAQLEIPSLASAHTSTHDDRLWGGDGDDVMFAGPGRDTLRGDSGADLLAGEPFEFLQRDLEDTLRSSLSEHRYADSLSPRRRRDPAIVIGPADDDWGADRRAIENPQLAIAIGEHLRVPVQQRPDGTLSFTQLVTASDLAEIVELNLSDRGLTDLRGIEHLVGLRTLDLSDNDLTSSDLQSLRPAAAGGEGLQQIEHLNLDRNQITGQGHLGQLSTLRALSVADQQGAGVPGVIALSTLAELRYLNVSGNRVSSLAPLANLANLRILDASGDIFAQQGLNEIDLRSFAGTQVYDASIFSAEPGWHVRSDAAATGGSYLVLDTVTANRNAQHAWGGLQLKPGQYEVYAAWHGGPAHHPQAIYSINGEESGRADQRLASRGRSFGDRQLQQIGTYEADGGQVEVELRAGAGDGLLIADALVLRPTAGGALDHLLHLDLRGTALSDTQRDLLLGDFDARGGVLHVDPIAAPQWTGPTVLAIPAGNAVAFDDLNAIFRDRGAGPLTFAASSDEPTVNVAVDGNELKIDTDGPVERLVHLSITATNSEGLATTVVIPIAVGFGVIEGNVVDAMGQPIEGIRLRGDNRSGLDFTATTDVAGRFVLLARGEGAVVAGENANLATLDPISTAEYDVRPGEIISPLDFVITPGLQFSLPPSVREGEAVSLDIEDVVDGEYQWSISGGPFEFTAGSQLANSEFIPRDAGIYTITAELRGGDARYVRSLPLVVEEVVATAAALPPVAIEEGWFRETLTLIEDGGNDVWDVRIDFGNGESTKLLGTDSRDYAFDVAYPEAGLYTVDVTVVDGDAVSRESFNIKVLETIPELASQLTTPFVQGSDSGMLEVTIDDPSGRLNRYTWSFLMDWRDGSPPQDVSHLLELEGTPERGRLSLSHVYALDGSYQPRLSVVDDDGELFELTTGLAVENDLPEVALEIPDSIIEDTAFGVSLSVEDSDSTTTVWDFGDASAQRSGTQATHTYARSGDYTITATTTDSDGAVTLVTATVTVVPVNDPPSVDAIPPQRVSEAAAFSWQVNASDEDQDTLAYALVDAPAGITIDAAGMVRWTPTLQQGPASYQFHVEVSDDDASVLVPVSIDVLDTGSIRGRLFLDANLNGRWDSGELPLSDSTVRLDAAHDGLPDRQTQTLPDGQFHFDALPLGTYRVIAESQDGFDFTTPSQMVVDLTVAEPIALPDFGGLLDSDGDGRTNAEERSTAAGLDGNGDGVPDWLQSNVASLEVGAGVITVASGAGTRLTGLAATAVRDDSPAGTATEWGRVSFDVGGLAPGGRARVELRFTPHAGVNAIYQVDEGTAADAVFRLLGSDAGESIEDAEDGLSISLRDGGTGDLDALADGRTRHSWQFAESDRAWTNPLEPLDTNGDGRVTPVDALVIINELNRRQGSFELTEDRPPEAYYFDVNDDGWVTPIDALRVINELNRRGGTGSGEGESQSPPPRAAPVPSPESNLSAEDEDRWAWMD